MPKDRALTAARNTRQQNRLGSVAQRFKHPTLRRAEVIFV
jgi:hypothetical protein